jgi:hypothetical protein
MFVYLDVHLLLSPTSVKRTVEWNTLKVKWGPDPLVSDDDVFVRQPRTVQQALQEQYQKLPNGLGDQCIGKSNTDIILLMSRMIVFTTQYSYEALVPLAKSLCVVNDLLRVTLCLVALGFEHTTSEYAEGEP